MSFLGDLFEPPPQQSKTPKLLEPAPYVPTPSILTEGMDKAKDPNPGAIQAIGIRG